LAVNVHYNLLFAAVNLLPIPPLDGSRVLSGLLPQPYALTLSRWETGGLVVLVLLLVSRYIDVLIQPVLGALRLLVGVV
ncbi:MAG TPA: site-2 protease family protein, partial [Limnochordia bacterium]